MKIPSLPEDFGERGRRIAALNWTCRATVTAGLALRALGAPEEVLAGLRAAVRWIDQERRTVLAQGLQEVKHE